MRFLASQCFHFCFYLVVAISQVFCKTCPPLISDTVDISCDYEGDFVNCRAPIFRGSKARLACKESYNISTADDPGYRELTCLSTGSWSHPLFVCSPEISVRVPIVETPAVKKCPALSSKTVDIECMNNGEKVSCESPTTPGTKAQLSCKEYYQILFSSDPGYREITCLEDGKWDLPVFRCIPECGTVWPNEEDLIVNGSTINHDQFPWRVNVYKKNSTGSYTWITDGTLISPDLMIVQADSIVEETVGKTVNVMDWAVAAGNVDNTYDTSDIFAQKSMVRSVEIAEGFKGLERSFADNLALIRLETSLNMTTLVRPVCMDWAESVGYSKTESQGISQSYMHYEKCHSDVIEIHKHLVTPDTFCTDCGYEANLFCTDVGQGGSFICKSRGLWFMLGRLKRRPSVDKGSCEEYYAYVKVGPYLKWIRDAYDLSEF